MNTQKLFDRSGIKVHTAETNREHTEVTGPSTSGGKGIQTRYRESSARSSPEPLVS